MSTVKVVTEEEYLKARLELLAKEKELTRANDNLTAQRQALPVVEVVKPYQFTAICRDTGEEKTLSLTDLFRNRRQLIIYHFMLDPNSDVGCNGCCFVGDHIPPPEHMNSRDTSFVVVSRAPIAKIEAFKKRMGWSFLWVSSHGSDFNYDFHVTMDKNIAPVQYNYKSEDEMVNAGLGYATKGEQPGLSCFILGGANGVGEKGRVYHTYSTYSRGLEKLLPTMGLLDLTKLGRQTSKMFPRRDEYTPEELKGTA